jgi:phage terminase large subunit-like protein
MEKYIVEKIILDAMSLRNKDINTSIEKLNVPHICEAPPDYRSSAWDVCETDCRACDTTLSRIWTIFDLEYYLVFRKN